MRRRMGRYPLQVSLVFGLGVTAIAIIVNTGFQLFPCTVPYLNPGQHFMQCMLYRLTRYFLIFLTGSCLAWVGMNMLTAARR